MLEQIKNLSKLELCNLYGLNVFRFSKDKQTKRKSKMMMVIWIILILILISYVVGFSVGFVMLGLEKIIPAYLIVISSLVIFFFGIFKAGSVIFRKEGYDMLCSLPVSQTAIVISRFIRMYVENLMLTLLVMLPGMVVYSCFVQPKFSFYLIGLIVILAIPLAPIAAATLIGAIITGISSRMKHKSLVGAGLTIAFTLVALLFSSKLSMLEGELTPEMMKGFSEQMLAVIGKMYPPAIWLGTSMTEGNIFRCLACVVVFVAAFVVIVALVSCNFHSICRGLFSTSAKHDYQMGSLQKNSVLLSLYKKEMKRYFASSIYVSNTIMGPIMGVALSGALLVVGVDSLEQMLTMSVDICSLIPFGLSGVFCMMTTTSVSISMEGKEWWIVKSLPLQTKTILDSKILWNLSLMLPFYVVSEILLMIAMRPRIAELFWMLVIPAVMMVFSCVYGITINLHFPVFDWESETTVVKQSVSTVLGGMGGFIASILCAILCAVLGTALGAVPVALAPEQILHLVKAGICILLFSVTCLLYRKNNSTNLKEL